MVALTLTLLAALQAPSSPSFRTRMIVEDAGKSTTYVVYYGQGMIRVDPPEVELYVLVGITPAALTLVYPDPGCYYRLEPPEHRSLIEAGVLKLSWFPWVSPVSIDLVEGVSLESRGRTRLPDGRAGLRFEGRSPAYDRVVAAYSVDPAVSPELVFQWREVYGELWGESPDTDEAQQKRFALYDQLLGLPVVSEERFAFLSRARTTFLEGWERVPDDPFAIPDEYQAKDPKELYWDSVGGRLLRQLGVKGSESDLCAGAGH